MAKSKLWTSNLDDKYPSNIGGALLFLSYIVAALVLSTQALLRIYSQYNARKRTPAEKRSLTILSILTLVSFSTLSFNMLSFLILSYRNCAEAHRWTLSLQDLRLWEWMSHSSLFEDFANAIVHRPEVWWWTQSALLVSFEICLWMSHKFRHDAISGLGNLILISQILPISFTLNLAYLTIATSPPAQKQPTGQRKVTSPATGLDGSIQFITAIIYLVCLYSAPQVAGQPTFIPLVILIRMLLCSPYFLQDGKQSGSAGMFLAVLGFALQAEATSKLRESGTTIRTLAETIFGHPAMRSIGQDVVLAAVSVAVYLFV